MYKGFLILVREGQAREVVASTDNPFSWFPELKLMFEHFKCKEMEFEIETTKQGIQKKIFKIIKK